MREELLDTVRYLSWLRDRLKASHRPGESLSVLLAASLVDVQVKKLEQVLSTTEVADGQQEDREVAAHNDSL